MSTPLTGTVTEYTLAELRSLVSDEIGVPSTNTRLQDMVLRWMTETLKEIQIADPKLQRTVVHDADFSLQADVAEYDVRNGAGGDPPGFDFTNCFEVKQFFIPEISSRPLDMLSLEQWRNRSFLQSESGPAYAVVYLDQFRVRFHPTPTQVYDGKADYWQDIPDVTISAGVDWPRAWDAALSAGVLFRAVRWHRKNQPNVWRGYEDRYERKLGDIRSHDRTGPRRPNRAVATRNMRSRRLIPRDNSVDVRWYRR